MILLGFAIGCKVVVKFGHFGFNTIHEQHTIVIEKLGNRSLGFSFPHLPAFGLFASQQQFVHVVVFLQIRTGLPDVLLFRLHSDNKYSFLFVRGVERQHSHQCKVSQDADQ